jgi:hypothetical protein
MELPLKIVVAVVVSVIVLLVIIALAFFLKESGQQAIEYLWNIPEFIKQLIKGGAEGANEAAGNVPGG